MSDMQRREFITLFGGASAALPFAARAEQPTIPVVGLINAGAPESAADRMIGVVSRSRCFRSTAAGISAGRE
jgi:hypothetical protein